MIWSYSAHQTMRRCQHQFVLGEVVAHHGEKYPDRREAFLLGQLQDLSAWQGTVIHEVLANDFLAALRQRLPPDPTGLTAAAVRRAQRQFQFSEASRYRAPKMTKSAAKGDFCALFDHEYGNVIAPEQLAAVYSNFAQAFDALASQTELRRLLRQGYAFQAEQSLTFSMEATAVRCVPDLVFLRAPGQPVVVDWKAAESETSDYAPQLQLYGLALVRSGRWPDVQPSDIQLFEVNLLQNVVRQFPFGEQRLDRAEDFVYQSVMEMRRLTDGARFDSIDWNDYEITDKATTCQHCKFKRICAHNLAVARRESITANA